MSAEQVRKQGLDKFYTRPQIAKDCLDIISEYFPWGSWDLVVEPSAGNGSFLDQIPTENKIGVDISPDSDHIIKQDFLEYVPEGVGKILVVGNPPFGKVSSLAIKFFNHASAWADAIAFIIPRTFRRIGVQNRLNVNFRLIHDSDIPISPCSFSPNMSVKCCFQIWVRTPIPRQVVKLPTTHPDWDFLGYGPPDIHNQPTPPSRADFAIRAYGGRCGEIFDGDLSQLRPKSWHWIKSKIDIDVLKERFSKIDYSIGSQTARQNSVGRADLVSMYSEYISHRPP